MTFDELPYAFCRHATSKIKKFEDIYNLSSFGFRGEALASIASISRMSCHSIPKDKLSDGGKIEIHGGRELTHVRCGGTDHGTTIFIKDIFFNTPVRMKFVKSKGSEKNSLVKLINSFVINNPTISFSVKWDDKDRLIYKALEINDYRERFLRVFGKGKMSLGNSTLVHVDGEYGDSRFSAEVMVDVSKGSGNATQFIFVNGRYVEDKQIHHAVTKGMENVWPAGFRGTYCLMITVPPSQIDVNIHPRKTEVKFKDGQILYSLIVSSISKVVVDKQKIRDDVVSKSGVNQSIPDYDEQVDWGSLLGAGTNDLIQAKEIHPRHEISVEIGKRYRLHVIDDEVLVYDVKEMLIDFLCTLVGRHEASGECQVVPLLVASVVNVKYEDLRKSLIFLERLGIEVFAVLEEKTAIKTLPVWLEPFRNHVFLNVFIEIFIDKKIDSVNEFYSAACSMKIDSSIVFTDYQIKKIRTETKLFKVIDESSLATIFKDS